MFNRYRKSIAALVGTIATWGVAASADHGIDPEEWWALLAALGTVLAVWGVPNDAAPGEAPRADESVRG